MADRRKALLAVAVSAACFGTTGVLMRLAYTAGVSELPMLAWRFAAAALVLAGVQLVRDRTSLRVSGRDLLRFAGLALTGYVVASVCFAYAVQLVGASVTTVLLYAYPALVGLIGWVALGERFTWGRAAAVVITFAGCALVAGVTRVDAGLDFRGVLLGLGAAVGYSLYTVLSQRWAAGHSRLVVMTYMFVFAALVSGALALATGGTLSPAGWHAEAWPILGLIVAVPTLAAVMLYLGGIQGLGASQAALVSTLEPVFTLLLSAFVLQERLGWVRWAGAAVVLAGVVLAERARGSAVADDLAGV